MADPNVDLVRKLVALSLFNSESKEASNAFRTARRLIAKHGISQGDLFAQTEAAAWGVDDFLRAGDKVKDVVAAVKAVAADPETQKTVAAVRDIGSAIARGVAAIKKARAR